MPEIAYLPDPRAADTPPSREYDCDCVGGSGGSGADGQDGAPGAPGAAGTDNISGAGSPVGVVTPTEVDQFYRDTTGNALWQATGLANTDWIQWI